MTVTREDYLPRPKPPPRRRWPIVVAVVLVVLAVLLVLADRGAAAYAENSMADEIRKEGFGAKPDVSINGVPFLTQAVSRRFDDVRLKARDVKQGPLNISTIDVRARDVRLDSGFRSGTLGSVAGTAFVGFGDLAGAGGEPGLELSAAGPAAVRAKIDLAIVEGTATASVTKEGNNIRVKATSVEGIPLEELGDTLDFTVPVEGLPLGMTFQSLTVSAKGVTLRVTGSRVAFKE